MTHTDDAEVQSLDEMRAWALREADRADRAEVRIGQLTEAMRTERDENDAAWEDMREYNARLSARIEQLTEALHRILVEVDAAKPGSDVESVVWYIAQAAIQGRALTPDTPEDTP